MNDPKYIEIQASRSEETPWVSVQKAFLESTDQEQVVDVGKRAGKHRYWRILFLGNHGEDTEEAPRFVFSEVQFWYGISSLLSLFVHSAFLIIISCEGVVDIQQWHTQWRHERNQRIHRKPMNLHHRSNADTATVRPVWDKEIVSDQHLGTIHGEERDTNMLRAWKLK